MISNDSEVRVRYGEVDMMGYLYHSHYVELFDLGRNSLVRQCGITYAEIEKRGVMMPVLEVGIKYKNPAYYDDLLTVRTILKEIPRGARIRFDYEVYRDGGKELITEGFVVLGFMDSVSHKPVRPPRVLMDLIEPLF